MHLNTDTKAKEIESLFAKNCLLYFPANRFEEPAWLNYANLNVKAEFSDVKRIHGLSNRHIVQYSPLLRNRNWLLDVLLDREIYEKQIVRVPIQPQGAIRAANIDVFTGYRGAATNLYEAANRILRLVMQGGNLLRFGFGPRRGRDLAIMEGDRQYIPNVFQLSTGETALLNIFLSILRDFDLTDCEAGSLDAIRGVVLIDEVDSHLHCELQSKVLPAVIKCFPQVQFIMTSHSPLFLLGLRREFSSDGFSILAVPEGNEISAERFGEFDHAYDVLKESSRHSDELTRAVAQARLPVVFVEGDYDVRYLRKAASLFGKEQLLAMFDLVESGGFGGLNGIWKQFDCRLASVLPRRVILLYDCDVAQVDADRDRAFKRVIPTIASNPIAKGIENLFPKADTSR